MSLRLDDSAKLIYRKFFRAEIYNVNFHVIKSAANYFLHGRNFFIADTYTINASNQIVTGTAAGEMFEFISSSTNNTFTNVVINAAGGKDTIKATTSQTIDATITGLDKSSVLDFGDRYANDFYYATPADGIELTNYSGSFKMKFSGLTDASIVSQLIVVARQQQTKWDDYLIGGTDLADTISVNHLRCDAKAYGGDDIILTAKNDNLLNGNSGNDILVATGSNNTLQGEDGQDVLICGGSNNIINGGDDTTTDYLFGGAGADVFQVGKNDGNDAVFGAANNDVIHLYDVTVSDIISYSYDANTIALGTNSGNVISVVNGDAISPTFILADGSAYRFNRAAYAWQNA